MFIIYEEIHKHNDLIHQPVGTEWLHTDFAHDLSKLKNLISITEKKKELWSDGAKEHLLALAKNYIDTILNRLAEKQTETEIQNNHKLITWLIHYIENPNAPIDQSMITQIADGNRAIAAQWVAHMVQDARSKPWIVWSIINRLWIKDWIIS